LAGNYYRIFGMRALLLLGIVISFSSQAVAQTILEYDSLFETENGLKGTARFQYYLRDGKRIRNGEFFFWQEARDSSDQTLSLSHSWSGNYKEGVKDGEWVYKGIYRRVEIKEIGASKIEYLVNSIERVQRMSYKSGFPVQRVSSRSTFFQNGQKLKDKEVLETSFNDHRIHGDFYYERWDKKNLLFSIKGKAEKGLMIGTWVFNRANDSILELRIYERGILLELFKIQNGDTVNHYIFPLHPDIVKELKENISHFDLVDHPLSLTFSDGYPGNSEFIEVQGVGNALLQDALDLIFQYESETEFQFGFPLGTSRGIYPLTEREKEAMLEWPILIGNFDDKVHAIKNLNIDRLEFLQDSVLRGVSLWLKRQDPILEKILSWHRMVSSDQIEYYNRENLLVDYARETLETDNIFINGQNKLIIYPINSKLDTMNFVVFVASNLESRILLGDSLEEVAMDRLKALKYAQQIYELNEHIKSEKHLEDSLYSQLPESLALGQVLEKTNNHFFENTFSEQYERFKNVSSAEEHLFVGREIISELEKLDELLFLAREIEKRDSFLDSLFTEFLFDPFTYSDSVAHRIKKKLYDPVVNELIPQGIKQAGEVFQNPFEVYDKLNIVSGMQIRLIHLRYRNTQLLEKKLKRGNSYQRKLEDLMEE
jgi:hypothetical protein